MRVFLAAILAWSVLLFAGPAYAQVDLCPGGNFANLCIKATGTGKIVSSVITILLIVAVVLSIIFLIWGGVKWITAGGDKGAIEGARSTIIAAIIGLVIAFLAFFIFNLVLYFFGIGSGSFTIPKLTS